MPVGADPRYEEWVDNPDSNDFQPDDVVSPLARFPPPLPPEYQPRLLDNLSGYKDAGDAGIGGGGQVTPQMLEQLQKFGQMQQRLYLPPGSGSDDEQMMEDAARNHAMTDDIDPDDMTTLMERGLKEHRGGKLPIPDPRDPYSLLEQRHRDHIDDQTQNMVERYMSDKGATWDGDKAPTRNDVERLIADPSIVMQESFDYHFGENKANMYLGKRQERI